MYAVEVVESIFHEGDETSRTRPGHGYPAYTEQVNKMIKFETEGDLTRWIERNPTSRYKAFRIIPLNISTNIIIKVEEV